MSEKIDALLAYMADAGEQARHHEGERSSFTNAGLGFAGAIATIAATAGFLPWPLLIGGLAIILLAVFGLALSLKSYERNRFHVKAFELTREAVDAAIWHNTPPPTLTELRKDANRKHRGAFRTFFSAPRSDSDEEIVTLSALVDLRLNRLWLFAWMIVFLAGLAMAAAGGCALRGAG